MQVIGLAIILALFFAPLKNDYESVQTRIGFIQEFCAFNFVGMLQNVAVYPMEKDVFYREHDDGTYGVEAFLAQYITLEVPFEIGTSLVFAVLTDLAAGLPRTPQMFFVCFFNCFCIVNSGESLGIMVCLPFFPFHPYPPVHIPPKPKSFDGDTRLMTKSSTPSSPTLASLST
jgi:hypothetical protein